MLLQQLFKRVRGRPNPGAGAPSTESDLNLITPQVPAEAAPDPAATLNQVAAHDSAAAAPTQSYQRGTSVFLPYQSPEEIAAAESMLIYDIKFIVGQCCQGADEAFIRKFSAMVDQLITGMIELCSVAPASMGPHDAGVHGLVHHNLQTAFVACDQIHHILSFIPVSTISCSGKLPESSVNVKPPKPKLGSGLTPEEVVVQAPSAKRKAPVKTAPAPNEATAQDTTATAQAAAKTTKVMSKSAKVATKATTKTAKAASKTKAAPKTTPRRKAPQAQAPADLAPEIRTALAVGPTLNPAEPEVSED